MSRRGQTRATALARQAQLVAALQRRPMAARELAAVMRCSVHLVRHYAKRLDLPTVVARTHPDRRRCVLYQHPHARGMMRTLWALAAAQEAASCAK